MLHNEAIGRYHPVVFRRAPAPSEDPEASVSRYRSRGHHTQGFKSLIEALAYVEAQPWTWVDIQWEWDGQGVPAIVVYLPN